MGVLKRINWVNTLFLLITPIVGIAGTALLCVYGLVAWPTWILAGVYIAVTGLAVTAGYHRLFSHKSYKAAWPIRLILLLCAAGTFEGSALEWCTDHRRHHLYADTEKDPYNINKGFWWAHIGWLFMLDTSRRDFSNVEDLQADPLVRFQHRFYVPLAILMGFIVPAGIAALWGNPIAGLVIAGALRIVVNHHLTFCINSVCHVFGKRTYSDRQSARDNWVTAFFTYGEGFHNFHHQFPLDYRNGIRAFHFDPTKWLIRGFSYVGLARDLRRIDAHRIIRYRLRTDEKRLLSQSAEQHESFLTQVSGVVDPMRERIIRVLNRIEALEKEYLALRGAKIKGMRSKIQEYRKHLKAARKELKNYMVIWSRLVREPARLGLLMEG